MSSLHSKVLDALADRANWEDKQRIYYKMRHDGLRRKKKPFPGCADLHYPLIDQQITKAKPFYKNQAYTSDRLAVFSSMRPNELKDVAASAADYFDWHVKQKTNFSKELLSLTDTMLLTGKGIMKVRWDVLDKKLEYESVDPMMFIVPASCKGDVSEADWFVHVKHETVDSYKRKRIYNQDPELIERIRGGKDAGGGISTAEQDKYQREGITFTKDEDRIIVFEHWKKTQGSTYEVRTYSPQSPSDKLREAFVCAYRMNGKPYCPYFQFDMEVKDKGFYSSRGLAEKTAPYEAWLCRLWNGKADAMDFYNKPMFNEEGLTNTANPTFAPGSILKNLTPVQMPEPPISFDEEMMQTKSIADNLAASPDANITPRDAGKSEFPTATQTNYQQQLASIGIDLNGWIFRLSLCELYKATWSLLVQYQPEELSYFVAGDLKILPQQALHDNYHVMPDGSPDQWNKQARQQQAGMMMQMFRGDPAIDQDELKRISLENFDPRYPKRLLLPSGMKDAEEGEDEAMEIVILMAGYPAVVRPDENHALRISVLEGKLHQLGMTGQPVDPTAMQRLQGHLAEHMKFLQQQNPQAYRQVIQQIQQAEQGGAPMQPGQSEAQPQEAMP